MPKVTIREAAELLGISENAVKKRLQRGTLRGAKGESGRWSVDIPDDIPADKESPSNDETLLNELRARLQDKNEQILFLQEELQRKDSILLTMARRLPELPPPDRADPDRDQAVTDQARQRMEARRQEASAQETRRPWWKFWAWG